MTALLRIEGLRSGYGEYEVLHEATVSIDAGSLVVLTGPNGAGKTTLLSTIVGEVPAVAGEIAFDGTDLLRSSVHERRALGISHVPEGRGLFPNLTVWENLRVAAHVWGLQRTEVPRRIDRVVGRFPAVGEKLHQPVSTLSGGQQQLVSIARALLNEPRLLLLDEPSTGLAPMVWREVVQLCRQLTDRGCSVLMVEQRLLDVADEVDRYALLQRGVIVREGPGGSAMLNDPDLLGDYLGRGHQR